ncbi:hypothetical protein [Martelella alba]|uniref:Uncharacterized protein n=1 Tax=Martelella alba TaxID=2590451 RepID=A0ABY2SLW6_9HYPH|nr:hypothetical protein [Martelella alba]TKI05325.1 hypothetical protein FCN80_14525 [Martelella alba]
MLGQGITGSLPNLDTLTGRIAHQGDDEMLLRLLAVRPVQASLSLGSLSLRNLAQCVSVSEPGRLKRALEVYALLNKGPREAPLPQLTDSGQDWPATAREKCQLFLARQKNRELAELLGACQIRREEEMYIFEHPDWYLSPVSLPLHSAMTPAEKRFYSDFLHGLHYGAIRGCGDLREFPGIGQEHQH